MSTASMGAKALPRLIRGAPLADPLDEKKTVEDGDEV